MANHNSRSAGGSNQFGVRSASEPRNAQRSWDPGSKEGSKKTRCKSDSGISEERLHNFGDCLFDKRSKDFEPRDRTFADTVPCLLGTRAITLKVSSDSHETQRTLSPPLFDEKSDLEDVGNLSVARHRSPSPRTRIRNAQSHPFQVPQTTHLSPMERYFVDETGQNNNDRFSALSDQEWKRLKLLRVQAIQLRSELRYKRRELRARQLTKSAADDGFMKLIRDSSISPNILADGPLGIQYEKMQAARNEYGPVEDDYNILEEELDDIDFEMAKYEARLISTPALEETRHASTPIETSDLTEEALLGLSSTLAKDSHPLRDSYFSRLGDHDLLVERYQNLEQEYERIQYKISRAALGLDLELLEYENTFLEDFPSRRERLELDISEVEKDIERIREECLAEGVSITESASGSEDGSSAHEASSEHHAQDEERVNEFDIDISSSKFDEEKADVTAPGSIDEEQSLSASSAKQFTDMTTISDPEVGHDVELIAESSQISSSKIESDVDILENLEPGETQWTFRILIPPFDDDHGTIDNLLIDYDEGNKGNRINRWMLHKLRKSHLDTELLLRVLFHFLGIYNWRQLSMTMAEWEKSVLFYWEKDEANRGAETFDPDPTETLLLSTTPSVKQSTRANNPPALSNWNSLSWNTNGEVHQPRSI